MSYGSTGHRVLRAIGRPAEQPVIHVIPFFAGHVCRENRPLAHRETTDRIPGHDGVDSGIRDHGWLIDFEFAGYGHASTDLAWVNVPGPMWLTVGDAHAETLETD